MNKTIKKIALILIIIILLPTLIYTVYEITSMNENEELIEKIYTDQLETIIFSVNQYSDDVVNGWAVKINSLLHSYNETDELEKEITRFISDNSALHSIFFSDSSLNRINTFGKDNGKSLTAYSDLLKYNKFLTERLLRYRNENYRKLEPLTNDDKTIILFILDYKYKNMNICGLAVDAEAFVSTVLNSKIRSTARDEFTLTVFNPVNKNVILTTETESPQNFQQSGHLWLLPQFNLGVSLKGITIEELAKERAITSLILIGLLNIVLITGMVLVFRNIKKEVELAQIKSDFVSNVSHELRTPLALISVFAETLEMGRVKSDEKRIEYYSIINQETNRLSRIVNKILNFSQIEAGKRKYTFEKKDINELVDKVGNTYKFHLENNGFKFSIEKEIAAPLIDLDEEAVSEAVINLIDNAMKYSKDQKEITLRTGRENNFVYVEVSDKGIGIPEEHHKRIFEKFFRITTGYIHNTKGTGLGLTLVQHIVNAHKGEVNLSSEPGRGSTFRLKFPLSKRDAANINRK